MYVLHTVAPSLTQPTRTDRSIGRPRLSVGSPPQGREDVILQGPALQHAGDAEEGGHESRVENECVYQ